MALSRKPRYALLRLQQRFYSSEAKKDGPPPEEKPKTEDKKDDKETPEQASKQSKGSSSDDFFQGFRRPSSGRSGKLEPPPVPGGTLVTVLLVLTLVVLLFMPNSGGSDIDWTTFVQSLLDKGEVEKLVVDSKGEEVYVYIKGQAYPAYRFRIGSSASLEKKMRDYQDRALVPYDKRVVIQYKSEGYLPTVLSIIPSLVIFGLLIALTRGTVRSGNMFQMPGSSKKNHLVTADKKPKMRFNDVAGLSEAKVEIMEFVNFLQNPAKYRELGAKIPRGALLVGPPGTGKTLLAKATAGEAGVPFFSMSGSDFVEMYVGVGPARVRDLFAQARQKAPCIIFIDEIDAVGRKRSKGQFYNDERENTLNQLLVEMDGFSTTSGVIVLAGTNRADILDKALMRPGRFDRLISIDPPDKSGRIEIFKVHLKPIKLDKAPDEYAEKLATLTPGFVGADIANVCNEAALIAARKQKKAVDLTDLEAAIERVLGGLEKKTKILPPKEKRTVAFHEAGHAVAGWFLEHASPLLKVSIIPRGSKALGYAQYQPKEQFLHSQEQLFDMMCMTIGGRVAEALIFGKISSGAEDDLQKITSIARKSIIKLGMSKRIGLVAFPDGSSNEFAADHLYSNDTARMIDEEVRDIVAKVYQRTYQLLEEHKAGLETVANLLLEKEVLQKEDLERLLGMRPFPIKKLETAGEVGTLDERPSTTQTATQTTEQPAASTTEEKKSEP